MKRNYKKERQSQLRRFFSHLLKSAEEFIYNKDDQLPSESVKNKNQNTIKCPGIVFYMRFGCVF